MATKSGSRLKVVQGDDEKPRNASQALGQQSMAHLECRDLRHPWSVVGLFYAQGPNGRKEVHRRLVCARCGTEATDKWSPKGNRIRREYKYAAGYQSKGIRIKPVDVRREVLQRVTVFGSEEEMLTGLFRGKRKRA